MTVGTALALYTTSRTTRYNVETILDHLGWPHSPEISRMLDMLVKIETTTDTAIRRTVAAWRVSRGLPA
jgi:hypothetical protein